MTILDKMNPSELEALAVMLHAEIHRSLGHSESPEIELKDVKDWIAFRKKEAEPHTEFSGFLKLL